MTDVGDLVAWLTQILDEEQAIAEQASPGPWRLNAEHDEVWAVDGIEVCTAFALSNNQLRWTANHIALQDPPSVLARIAADRQILVFWRIWNEPDKDGLLRTDAWAEATRHAIKVILYQLALAHADRPGYREEWRP